MFNDTYATTDECDIAPTATNISRVVLLIIIMAVTLIGNAIVMLIVSMSRVLQVQKTYYFLASLALADLLTGVVSMPIKIKQSYNNHLFCMSVEICWFYTLADTVFSITSVMHLVVIAVDRYVAIAYTYKYAELFNRKNVKRLALMCWSYAIIWSLLLIFRWDAPNDYGLHYEAKYCYQQNYYYFLTVSLVNYMLPTIIIASTYGYVYTTARKHIRAISLSEVFIDNKTNRRRKREFKALKTVLIVFIAFTICWLPTNLLSISILFKQAQDFWINLKLKDRKTFEAIFFVCVQILPPAQSALNPFIYVIFNRHYRLSLQGVIRRMAGDKTMLRKLERRMTFFSITQININTGNRSTEENSLNLTRTTNV